LIDLHSHFLFDVDDGANTLEDSIEMLRTAERDGVTKMVATPHQHHPAGYHVEPELARARLAEVKAAAEAEGIRMDYGLAAEIHFSEAIPQGIKEGALLPYSEDGRYFLFELPVTTIPGNIREVVFAIQMAGHFPVLAHPERNFEVVDRPKIVRDLRSRGVLMQLTAQSLLGKFGRKMEKVSRKLLKWGVVDIIASDAHNPVRRPPGLSEAVRVAAKIVGPDRAEAMVTETPQRILEGREVD
jgi:protein-tyrosine phosphatase